MARVMMESDWVLQLSNHFVFVKVNLLWLISLIILLITVLSLPITIITWNSLPHQDTHSSVLWGLSIVQKHFTYILYCIRSTMVSGKWYIKFQLAKYPANDYKLWINHVSQVQISNDKMASSKEFLLVLLYLDQMNLLISFAGEISLSLSSPISII